MPQSENLDNAPNAIKTCRVPQDSTTTTNGVPFQSDWMPLPTTGLELRDRSALGDGPSAITVSSNLWSAAFREAVESLQGEIEIATLNGKDAWQLFKELEDVAKEVTQKSVFLKGLRYLQTIQVPLQRFKEALDLASPLANVEPTAATVLGVVRGLTAVRLNHYTCQVHWLWFRRTS